MKTSMQHPTNDRIYRLRQQINLEENRGKLRVLVYQLQIALNQEQPRVPRKSPSRQVENPFDTMIVS